MESMLQWGLDVIRFVQTYANPTLTVIMRTITNFGAAPMYLTALPFIYWCIDEKKGMRLSIVILISLWINLCLKFLFNQPRPFFEGYDPSVGMIGERLGGLPSGHAQTSMVMLVIIASWIKKRWAYISAAAVCLLISFSRIYLGVHFPTDVFGGWILGGFVLCVFFVFRGRIEALLVKGGFRSCMIACAALSFIMILYLPSEELLMPGGTMLGMGAGYCLNARYVGFKSVSGRTDMAKYLILLVRFLLGITGLALIFIAVGKIIPRDSGNFNLFGFGRFALAGLWVSVGAPWVYIRLRLAQATSLQNAGKQKET